MRSLPPAAEPAHRFIKRDCITSFHNMCLGVTRKQVNISHLSLCCSKRCPLRRQKHVVKPIIRRKRLGQALPRFRSEVRPLAQPAADCLQSTKPGHTSLSTSSSFLFRCQNLLQKSCCNLYSLKKFNSQIHPTLTLSTVPSIKPPELVGACDGPRCIKYSSLRS